MQKLKESSRTRAEAILKTALPEDARVERPTSTEDPATLRLSLKHAPGFVITLLPPPPDTTATRSDSIPVFVLDGADPEERDGLRRRDLNFIDLVGAARLRTSGFFLDRDDLPSAPAPEARRQLLDPYTDKASRVVRRLLRTSMQRRWSVHDLATECHMAASTASRVIRELRRRELVRDDSPGQGRRSEIWVPEPEALLADWARSYRWQDNVQVRVAAPIGSPSRFIQRMPDLMGTERWALTLQAGASLTAPHSKFDVIHAYVDADRSLEIFAHEQGWEVAPNGKLCLLEPFYQDSVWLHKQVVEGVPVVSPVQLTIDLWDYPVRGREQARHLIESVLRPTWESELEQD